MNNQIERIDYYSKNLTILNIELCSAVIETCFGMLKSSEHKKLWCYSNYFSKKNFLKLEQLIP